MDINTLSVKIRQFLLRNQPITGTIQLNRRGIYILPTASGITLLFTIGLLGLMGLMDNNNLIYFLGFLLFSVFFITILHTYRNLAGLELHMGYAKPVFAGESAGFMLTITNPYRQSRSGLTASLEDSVQIDLAANASKTITLLCSTHRRGWLFMPKLVLAGRFPLGIFRAWSPLYFVSKVLVYPAPATSALPFPVNAGQPTQGQQRLDPQGRDDYNGVRPYQAGDPLRQIHWQAYAKGQGLVSKIYANSISTSQLWLDYDFTPGRHCEERLSQLCRWVIDAEQAGLSYGLQLPSRSIALGTGPSHYAACLEALALF
ncbi:DUF58 domain-containing protein [Methylomonas sp. AM2-LC]|uniref:DUF58 domain-containing protein n=1 Tax=Methylomonas sp. AM2-LC TaxID=3153301 RepID=UPI0032656070